MGYLANLYKGTMEDAYGDAFRTIAASSRCVLDCGTGNGWVIQKLQAMGCKAHFSGIEWDQESVEIARERGFDVRRGDLNKPLPFEDNLFECVYGLSVLEHILQPCHYIREAHRVLEPGGKLVLLTPNIATYFTALNILRGKMPSSGPHPDSNALQARNDFGVGAVDIATEGDTPTHRHLVVFSYSALRDYLKLAGFSRIDGRAYGYYPFPRFMQPALQKLDPWHCHQMVFVATK